MHALSTTHEQSSIIELRLGIITTLPARSNLLSTTPPKINLKLQSEFWSDTVARVPLTENDSIFSDQALRNFGLHALTKPELALTKHRKAKFMRDIGNVEAAVKLEEEASTSYFELIAADRSDSAASQSDADFERIVALWWR